MIGNQVTKDVLFAQLALAAEEYLRGLARFHALDVWISEHAAEITAMNLPPADATQLENVRAEMASRYIDATANGNGETFHMRKVVGLNPLV